MRNSGELERENEALRDHLYGLIGASLRINESLDFETVLQGVVDSARVIGVLTVDYARRRVTMAALRRMRSRSGSRRERGESVGRRPPSPSLRPSYPSRQTTYAEGPGRLPRPHLPCRRLLNARKCSIFLHWL